ANRKCHRHYTQRESCPSVNPKSKIKNQKSRIVRRVPGSPGLQAQNQKCRSVQTSSGNRKSKFKIQKSRTLPLLSRRPSPAPCRRSASLSTLPALRHCPAPTSKSSPLLSLVQQRLADYHCEQPAHSFHLSLLRGPTSPLAPTNLMTLTHHVSR